MCEVLDKKKLEQKNNKKNGLFQKIGIVPKEQEPLTAEKAWYESKHGINSYKCIEDRILDKQADIKAAIKSKFAPCPTDNIIRKSAYHCVIDIEEDLINYVDEIFSPFSENGFEIINLSKECKGIDSEGVFFISWKNAFKKKKS